MIDFSAFPIRPGAFSDQRLNILKPEHKAAFSLLMEILLLETGSRSAREGWQKAQFANLVDHAAWRSKFWAERVGSQKPSQVQLRKLPELSRTDLRRQVASEGALLGRADGAATRVHSTSGSSGEPVTFHVSTANEIYNEIRSLAQYLMEGRDLSRNWLRMKSVPPLPAPGYRFSKSDGYGGPLSGIFETGSASVLEFSTRDLSSILPLIKSARPGFMILAPSHAQMIIDAAGLAFFQALPLQLLIGIAEGVPEDLRSAFASIGVPFVSNYSSEEVGLIGAECRTQPGHFHVASSNVIVEEAREKVDVDGAKVGRLLITHLHSYATPLIRYDVGDLGNVIDRCPCGHDGPTIRRLLGRLLSCLKRQDGTRTRLYIRGQELQKVQPLTEFRIRQTALDLIELDVVSDEPSDDGAQRLAYYIKSVAGHAFQVVVRFVPSIDWGASPKRLAFRCEV